MSQAIWMVITTAVDWVAQKTFISLSSRGWEIQDQDASKGTSLVVQWLRLLRKGPGFDLWSRNYDLTGHVVWQKKKSAADPVLDSCPLVSHDQGSRERKQTRFGHSVSI